MSIIERIRTKFEALIPFMDERLRRLWEKDETLIKDLEQLVAPATRGDPCSPLLWTSKSTSKLAKALEEKRHQISPRTVAKLLKQLGYSLQSNRKTAFGSSHEDRDAQFQYINEKVANFQLRNQPVISVDTKKKEMNTQLGLKLAIKTLTI